jgi:hypothetical protein
MKNNCGGVVMKGGLGALIIYGKCWCLLGREVSGVAINKKRRGRTNQCCQFHYINKKFERVKQLS